jgi:hypothetical protein
MPTRWNVVPIRDDDFEGSGYQEDQFMEVIPDVDQDLLAEVRLLRIVVSSFFSIDSWTGKGEDS